MKPVQTDRFQFGSVLFFYKNQFGSVLARFFILALFFLIFFSLGSIRFFQFQAYKTEIEPVGFFKF
jgi:hypothetical protein